jgi:choline-glycine betaine transporter
MKKYIHYYIIIMAITIVSPLVLQSQPVGNSGTGGTNGEPDTPIDGGLSLLVAAGIGYGAKKMRNAKKQATL